jgi:hypothetical protein
MKIPDLVHEHLFIRSEFDWVGIDPNNEVGYFCSAGFGPIPKELNNPEAESLEFENELMLLALRSEIDVTSHILEWKELGKRGIHVYDWSWKLKEYLRVVRPKNPLKSHEVSGQPIMQYSVKINNEFQD